MNFHVKATSIHGVKIITYDSFEDERGFIFSTYKKSDFMRHKLPSFDHDKFVYNKKNVLEEFIMTHRQPSLPPVFQVQFVN